jgi:hypothetical protein
VALPSTGVEPPKLTPPPLPPLPAVVFAPAVPPALGLPPLPPASLVPAAATVLPAVPVEPPGVVEGESPLLLPPQADVARHSAPQAVAASPKNNGRKSEIRNAGVIIEH